MKILEDIQKNYYIHEGQEKSYRSLPVKESDFVNDPLWYHKQGLMQTATGYGSKLTTERKLKFNGREYRVYCSCFSNVGTVYIIVKGEKIVLTQDVI